MRITKKDVQAYADILAERCRELGKSTPFPLQPESTPKEREAYMYRVGQENATYVALRLVEKRFHLPETPL